MAINILVEARAELEAFNFLLFKYTVKLIPRTLHAIHARNMFIYLSTSYRIQAMLLVP